MKPVILLFVLGLVASVTHDAQAGIAGKGREKRSKLFWQGVYNRFDQFKKSIIGDVADPNRPSNVVSGTPGVVPNTSPGGFLKPATPNTNSAASSEVDKLLDSLNSLSVPSTTTPPAPPTVDPNASVDDMLKALEDLE